jgi:hypothetical protein
MTRHAWSRADKIAALGIAVAILTASAGFLVPELRRTLGLQDVAPVSLVETTVTGPALTTAAGRPPLESSESAARNVDAEEGLGVEIDDHRLIVGSWTGEFTQSGTRFPMIARFATVRSGSLVGYATYPTLACDAEWNLPTRTEHHYEFASRITRGNCVDGTVDIVVASRDTLVWTWHHSSGVTADGSLQRR